MHSGFILQKKILTKGPFCAEEHFVACKVLYKSTSTGKTMPTKLLATIEISVLNNLSQRNDCV